ncbi:hypothetical protein GCM10023225_23510 [Kineococcus glutinatus]|uniref:Aminotransferase class I/classII large domain-containing protein n=1 Tax=Kineococcus glutinatus TaxID=1070872 RepID=A0ABP9I000_9ACTN
MPELRSWFAQQLGAERDDVLITPGGQGALSSVLRALAPAGSPVLVAVPCYPGAIALLRSAGLVPVPVPTDADGVRPELLERAFATTGARALYVQPTYANPDGQVLAPERRRPLLECAAAAGAFVVEDDYARWLGHGASAPPSLLRDDTEGRVITVNSLTKVAASSLRIGCVVARGPVLQRIAGLRMVDDLFVARPLQETAVEFVTGSGWSAHLRTLSTALRERTAALRTALARHLPQCSYLPPKGGFSLWLQLPRGSDGDEVTARALAEGVTVGSGRHHATAEDDTAHLRLVVSAIEAHHVDEAVQRLARAVG